MIPEEYSFERLTKYLLNFGAYFAIYQVFSILQRSYTYENCSKISTKITQEFIKYYFFP